MTRPEQRSWRGAVGLTVGVVALAGLAVTLVYLDVRRREEVQHLNTQLDSLRLLVDDIRKQLDLHDQLINTTLQAKSTVKNEPAEEVVYEDEYEYDDEESSYEYEDEVEPNAKGTVKRTTVLSSNSSSSARTRRDVRNREVPVQEDSPIEQTENSNKPAHHKTQVHSSTIQEQARPAESIVRLRHMNRHRSINIDTDSQNSEEMSQPQRLTEQQTHILAAHFIGDASKYNQREDYHYYGNNILYHPHGLFKDWVPSSWMFELGTLAHFPLHNGKLSIQKSGIYFVYAQIYYAATHDRCGFHIKHNEKEVAQCMTMTSGRTVKRNTCFTAVVLHLHRDDWLWISEVEGYRNTSFKSSHSFFGLIQLKTT